MPVEVVGTSDVKDAYGDELVLVDAWCDKNLLSDFWNKAEHTIFLSRSGALLGYSGARTFQTELYGSQIICSFEVAYKVGTRFEDFEFPPASHGPGAFGDDGKPVLWNASVYEGLGTSVSRDDPAVVDAVYKALQGRGPLWFEPGFPGAIPESPSVFSPIGGGQPVEGVLCASIGRGGSYVVLDAADLAFLLGYRVRPRSWEELRAIFPRQAAFALVQWMLSQAV
jgi:hypothetical protein